MSSAPAPLNLAALLAGAAAGKSLAEIKAAHPAPRKAPQGAKPAPAPLPLAKSFALRKTGYISWKATARRVEMQVQICACGSHTTAVLGEFFTLENGTAHAVWLRPEGYGIEAPADLPLEVVFRDPRHVPVCGECADPSLSLLFDRLCGPKQLELSL